MTALATIDAASAQIEALANVARNLSGADEYTDFRARIEAARAWAKVHKKTKQVRLDLLRLEVLALVRIVELGAADTLGRDRNAAEWLANLSDAEREQFIRDSGEGVTTAAGMVRTIQRIESLERDLRHYRSAGQHFAHTPDPGEWTDEQVIRARQGYVMDIAAALANTVEQYAPDGEPFTIDEMADAIVADAAIEQRHVSDSAFMEGVREVCRKAIRSAPPLSVGGLPIPSTITALTPEEQYVRIPAANATVGHLDQMVEIRREQLAQDQAALARLEEVARALHALPGSSPESRIISLVAGQVIPDAA